MNNIADVTMDGEFTDNTFGISVSTAGDVNSDGYSDVIIGAERYASYNGRAYIYYGGASMNNIADVILSASSGGHFGFSVSSAGDVNGDGYADVIVGEWATGSFTGRAHIYYGGSAMNNLSDELFIGEATSNYFGYSVSSAGDVDGDGYSDVIIGAYGYNIQTGRAYIYYGNSNFSRLTKLTGETTGNKFGYSISTAGDVNGDGYSDIIIGAKEYNNSTGRAYVYFGEMYMDTIPDVIMTGEATNVFFGRSVSAVGDINGDGYADVIVGAESYFGSTGKSFIYFGGTNMNNTADVRMIGIYGYGSSSSSAGDVNGDGKTDLIIGETGDISYTGKSYIYFNSSPDVHPNILSVKDVVNDQGGFVKLKWAKSGLDIPVNGTVTQYIVERSVPPGAIGFQWEQIGTVLPTQSNTYYSYTATTPTDSGIIGNTTFFFRVTAYTNVAQRLYRSNILSGYSIDNLAPLPPANLAGALVVNVVELNWTQNSETDLRLIYNLPRWNSDWNFHDIRFYR